MEFAHTYADWSEMVKSSKIEKKKLKGRILRIRNNNIQNGKMMDAKDFQMNHDMQV